MTLHNIKKMKNEKGFTIVELLIVIVIIGILAAITIVAYNGITQRANTASAQAAAQSAISKMEAYNADSSAPTSGYPTTPGQLTTAASTATYQLSGVTFYAGSAALATAPSSSQGPSTLNFYKCTSGGAAVSYYDYTAKAWTGMFTGGATALSSCTWVSA